ncbi:unnamed protein product [Rhizophagus irregularis]|nr:unnamed protein product [Rhizophagus irregularis]
MIHGRDFEELDLFFKKGLSGKCKSAKGISLENGKCKWSFGECKGSFGSFSFQNIENGSEVEFESLKRLGISGIRYTVSGYLDKGQRKVKIKSMGLDTGHETASGYFEFKMLMGFESGAWDN